MNKAINRTKKGTHAHKDRTFLDEQSYKSNARGTYMKIHTYATKKNGEKHNAHKAKQKGHNFSDREQHKGHIYHHREELRALDHKEVRNIQK